MLLLVAHVGAGEQRSRESDEGGQGHEEDIERIDEELLVADQQVSFREDAGHQCAGGRQGRETDGYIDFRRARLAAQQPQEQRAEQWRTEQQDELHATVLLQRLEVMQVEAVELLADLEEEDAQHQHRDQHVQRHAKFYDHRHAVGRAHRAKEQPVLHRQEADHLRHCLAPRDHRQEGEQDHRDRDADACSAWRCSPVPRSAAPARRQRRRSTAPRSMVLGMLIAARCPNRRRGGGPAGAAARAGRHFERQRQAAEK